MFGSQYVLVCIRLLSRPYGANLGKYVVDAFADVFVFFLYGMDFIPELAAHLRSKLGHSIKTSADYVPIAEFRKVSVRPYSR